MFGGTLYCSGVLVGEVDCRALVNERCRDCRSDTTGPANDERRPVV